MLDDETARRSGYLRPGREPYRPCDQISTPRGVDKCLLGCIHACMMFGLVVWDRRYDARDGAYCYGLLSDLSKSGSSVGEREATSPRRMRPTVARVSPVKAAICR